MLFAMVTQPVNKEVVDQKIRELRIPDIGRASIREIVAIVNLIEKETGVEYVRMEMGLPGLPPAEVGTLAEIEALKRGVVAPEDLGQAVDEKQTFRHI